MIVCPKRYLKETGNDSDCNEPELQYSLSGIKPTNDCLYKTYQEGEVHFYQLVDDENELEYEAYIRDRNIEKILKVTYQQIFKIIWSWNIGRSLKTR